MTSHLLQEYNRIVGGKTTDAKWIIFGGMIEGLHHLGQYRSPKIPVFDQNNNAMHAIFLENEIIDLNGIDTTTLVGCIYGGIESSSKNIFFVNDGSQSFARTQVFKVFLSKENQSNTIVSVSKNKSFDIESFPNPSKKIISLRAEFSKKEHNEVLIYNMEGKELKRQV